MPKTKTVYRARSTFFSGAHHAPIVKGQDYEGDHPLVKKHPESFEQIRVTVGEQEPERATAEPGHKRPAPADGD